MISCDWSDKTVQTDIKFYSFKTIKKSPKPHVQVDTSQEIKTFSPEEISAMVLTEMKEIAKAFLGKKATHEDTKDAGVNANLTAVRIISEPTAAAIAYGKDKKEGEKEILVFDPDGGTSDVSILTIEKGIFEVIQTNKDTHLGGEDFNQHAGEHFIKPYKKKQPSELSLLFARSVWN